jgi:hypothetical protein
MKSKLTDYSPETAAPKKHNGGNCKLNFSTFRLALQLGAGFDSLRGAAISLFHGFDW